MSHRTVLVVLLGLLLAAPALAQPAPSATGLVLALGLGEGSGATVTDASGNANDGTITGAAWNTLGKYGNSLTFNGTNHVVLVPSSASLNLSTGMTLEAWVYPTAVQTGRRTILQREPDAYLLHASSLGSLRPTAGGTFNGALDSFAAPKAIPINTWTHLALTWNGTTMRLYVNGTEVASKTRTGTLQGTSSGAGAVRIGNNTPYGERFIGRIDEVRIYSRALSPAEIATDMASPIGTDTTPPTAPGSLSATANGATQVTLGWTASTDAGGSGLAGYRVERCAGAGCANFAEIAQPGTNAFVDTGLSPSTTYRYRVRAVDGAGNPSGYSSTANATTSAASDTTPPTSPSSLVAAPSGASRVDLTWTASTDSGGSGLAGYRIERCAGAGCANFAEIGTSMTSSFSDSALPAPQAQTELGRVAAGMAPGTWAEVSTLNMVPTLIADGIGGSILDYAEDGAWDPVTQQFLFVGCDHPFDQNGDLARFVAYSAVTNSWRVLPDPFWLPDSIMHGYDHNAIDPVRGLFYHRAYATPNVYRYDIRAGTWSALPPIPASVLANNTCCMGMEYFPELGGLVLAGTTHESVTDEVLLHSDTTGTWSTVADGRPMGTYNHFVEYNPVHHTVLFGGGSGSRKNYTMNATRGVRENRDAPFGLGILESVVTVDPVSGDYLVLGSGGQFYSYDEVADRWTALPGTVPLFGLPVRGSSLVWQILATPISNHGVTMFVKFYWADTASLAWVYLYKHAASSPAATLRYRVRAIDGAGNASGYSNTADAITNAPPDTTPPTAPGSLTATANGATQITLGWTASTDSGGSGLAGYRVERCTGATCSSFVEIAQPGSNAFVDTGLSPSTTYRYRVRAVDVAGNLSGYSNTGNATTGVFSDTLPPTVPGSPTATANGTSQITLGWTASTDSGGSGLAGYRVERCTGATCSSFVEIAQPATNAFLDNGLSPSTTYRYRVRAVDVAGNLSGYSSIASAQTAATSGLVAAFGFNEGSGTVANDSSGNANTGTVTGATWNTTGKYGSSLTFNGTSHIVTIPGSPSLNLSTAMTLEAWVFPTASQTGWRAIIQREIDAWFLHAGFGAGALRPTAGGTFGGALDYFSSPTALTVNVWSHLALTWDGTTMRLYVNGTQVATRTRAGTLQGSSAGAGAVRIGNNVPYGERFIGRIDEVRIYNRALSAAEVTADLSTPVP